jgi:hypothetical protein
MCWEIVGGREQSSIVVDLSAEGARLERPYMPRSKWDVDLDLGPAGKSVYVGPPPESRIVPLQIEVPGIDEVMWARGDVVFDELVQAKTNGGPFGLMRRTGLHISLAATRDLRLLRDYVYEMHHQRRVANDEAVDWMRCFG